ncbi:MAG: hypothetical protein IPJ07_14825 [Acidobacteria bacterium]|nr:hypothetical protein [Acidobacteriota bacterium]
MGTLIVLLFVLIAITAGSSLTWLVLDGLNLRARLAAGSVIGLALLLWIGYLGSLIFGLNYFSIALSAIILLAAIPMILKFAGIEKILADFAEIKLDKVGVIYFAIWAGLLGWLYSRVLMFQPDGIHTAPLNSFGDLPFHFSVITSFAYGDNFPPQNPIFAGSKFTYPFLIDFLTGFFMRCGADWRAAFFVENLILSLSLVVLIEQMAMTLTGDGLASRLSPVIFLFNGGLGFINFFKDLSRSDSGFADFMMRLPKTYTMNAVFHLWHYDLPLRWGNVFTTLLIPQRSMLFGLPFVAMIITLWWNAISAQDRRKRRGLMLAAGILAGMLPMLHAHGFFSVMIVAAPLMLFFFSWEWIFFCLPVAVLAGPQALWLGGSQVRSKLFQLHWGWEAGDSNPVLFWVVNAGVFILLLLVALNSYRPLDSKRQKFYLPFFVWFIVPNVVLLAPWPWDNIKVLVYWALVTSAYVAAILAFIFTRRSILLKVSGGVLLVMLTLAGALDVWRTLTPVENIGIFNRDDVEIAAMIREKTEPQSVILHAPIHNSLVALTGRRSVMGYPGHLWTHGIDAGSKQADVTAVYGGGEQAVRLMFELNVDYVLIGPVERSQLYVDEGFFAGRYQLIIDRSDYRLYRINKQWNQGTQKLQSR